MIAKRVPRPKGTSDFARLGRYVVDARGRLDPSTWARTADYLLDTTNDGAKVGSVRVTNCRTDDDPAAATLEIQAVQARNTRSRRDKTYHLVVAFPPGECPTSDQLRDIEDTLCAAIGLADHQRLSAVHTDRDHLHLHVAISTVHPRTFRNVEPFYDKRRLMDTCERLELKHGLTRTNHGVTRRSPTDRAGQHVAEERGPCPTRAPLRGQPAAMEVHGGRHSLLGWIAAHAADPLAAAAREGDGWQAVHTALARFDLELRPRGAGLVIGPRGTALAVKASDVDRALGMRRLTERFGPFVAASPFTYRVAPERRYDAGPRHTAPGTEVLFAAYQHAREAARATRAAASAREREARAAAARRLAAAHAEQRRAIRGAVHLSRVEKQLAIRQLAAQRAQDWAAHRRRAAAERATVRAAHPLPTWSAYLEEAALRGDEAALAVLRSRRRRTQQLTADLLAAENPARARHVVYTALHPQSQKSGDVRYHVQDGGVVTDGVSHVRVDQHTVGAVVLALSLAGDRFADQALVVRGSDAFRRDVAEHAGWLGLSIRFADAALDVARGDARRRAAEERAAREPDAGVAVRAYVDARNALRMRVSSVDHHRAWTPADAGAAEYRGQRTLTDRSVVLLLRRGGEMLVKPATPAEAAHARRWTIGRPVTADVHGHVLDPSHQQTHGRSLGA